MDWTSLALISASCLAIASIFDSHLVSRRMPSIRAFLFPFGFAALISCLVLALLFPFPKGVPVSVLLIMAAAGILRVVGYFIMITVFKKVEVSRVVPVVLTYPVFVAIMAMFLLGESLNYLQWLAIIMVVAGAITISFRQSHSGTTGFLGKPFLLCIGVSVIMAVADTMNKHVLSYMSFWNLLVFNTFCLTAACFVFSSRRRTFEEYRGMKGRPLAVSLVFLDQYIALAGMITLLWAVQKGPVSLVSTIAASRPVFVLIIALILSRAYPVFLPWQKGGRMLAVRFVATTMIFAGIALIYLT